MLSQSQSTKASSFIMTEHSLTIEPNGNHHDQEYVTMNSFADSKSSFLLEVVDLLEELINFNQRRSWKKKALTVFMVVSTILVVVDLIFLGNILRWIMSFAAWMSLHLFWGTLSFVSVLVVCTLVMIPPSILIFVCGYVFAEVCGVAQGIPAAILASFTGCVIGAVLAFVRARYMMRDLVNLFAKRYKIIRAADRAIQRHGFRVMLLLRLCPIVPFNGLNYIGGITAVSMEDFCFSLVGILPIISLTALAGATAEQFVVRLNQFEDSSRAEQRAHLSLVCAGLFSVVIAVCITIYFAKKELDREIRAELEAEDAKRAVGRNSPNGSTTGASKGSSHSSEQAMLDELQVEMQFSSFEEGVDDEEWFWFYA